MWCGVTPQGFKAPPAVNTAGVRGADPTKSPQGCKCDTPTV